MQNLEEYLPGYGVPAQSRARVMMYNGAVCPDSLTFGYVHGESPNRGEMTYEEDASPPLGKPLIIRCGFHVYYGMVVRSVKNYNVSSGNNRSISFVDMRDRLHDVYHYACYNMTDDDKFRIYHIFASDWKTQKRTYINQVTKTIKTRRFNQDNRKLDESQSRVTSQVTPFSAKTLLNNLGIVYNFKITATAQAMERLETFYPDNVDFNNGIRVANCISAIIDQLNLQFTCYGDLHVHITMKGVADNEFDRKLLAGTITLCALPNYESAVIGSELNERGRRVIIVGGRNKYEAWYPCYPAWNLKWNWSLSQFSTLMHALISKNNSTVLQAMTTLHGDYAGSRIIYDGMSSYKMSISQYVQDIPFRVYDIDFSKPLKRKDVSKKQFMVLPDGKDPTKEGDWEDFVWATNSPKEGLFDFQNDPDGFLNFEYRQGQYQRVQDSEFPISSILPSSYTEQFQVWGMNRSFENKGAFGNEVLIGKFEQIKEAANLNCTEILYPNSDDMYVRNLFKGRLFFNRKMFKVEVDGESNVIYSPDEMYVLLGTDREVFTYDVGDSYTSPRVRPIQKSFPDLFRTFFEDGTEDVLATYNMRTQYVSGSKEKDANLNVDQVAASIASMALMHEFLSTSGNIVFNSSCGFLPTGIIESVAVSFSAENGIQETTNFTNSVNNEQTPLFRSSDTRANASRKYTTGIKDATAKQANDPLVKEYLDNLRKAGKGGPPAPNVLGNKPAEGNPDAHFNHAHQAQAFGGLRNAIAVEINVDTMVDDKLRKGELLILASPDPL